MWKQYIKVKKFTSKSDQLQVKTSSETLLVELDCKIALNDTEECTLSCCPDSLEELAIGYLLIKEKVHSITDIQEIKKKNSIINVITNKSSTNPNKSFERKKLSLLPSKALKRMADFQEKSAFLKETGIAQSIAISTENELLAFSADLTTDIALYKCCGQLIKEAKQLYNQHLILYGTIDATLVETAYKLGISSIVSRSGITQKAYEKAIAFEISIITFCRGKHLTEVYNSENN